MFIDRTNRSFGAVGYGPALGVRLGNLVLLLLDATQTVLQEKAFPVIMRQLLSKVI